MAEVGQKVRIHYRSELDDGTEIDNSFKRGETVEFVIGSRTMLPGIEEALLDMAIGERKTIELPAEQAYGTYDESLIIELPFDAIPEAEKLPIGQYIVLNTPAGPARMKVLGLADDGMMGFDLNHELADRSIVVDILFHSIVREAAIDAEQHPHGCPCGCDKLKEILSVD